MKEEDETEKSKESEIQNKDITINDNNKINEEEINDDKLYYNDILCPYCYSSAIITNNGFNIDIINCENLHHVSNISYDTFEEVDSFPSIKCDSCSTLKISFTPPNNQFYKCICGIYLCPECYIRHEKAHNKIEIVTRNYKCILHDNNFNSYCLDCNMNICELCIEPTHINHEILKYINLKPKDDYIEKIDKEIKEQKKNLDKFIKDSKKAFEDIIKEVESYLSKFIYIEKTLLKKYKDKSLNYQILENIQNKKLFYNNTFLNKIKEFNGLNKDNLNTFKTFERISDIYNNIIKAKNSKKINEEPKIITKNEMILHYSFNEKNINKRIKIFDSIFVDNNRDKLRLIIEGKEEGKLMEYYYNYANKNDINVKIIEKKPITDMSYMFNNCKNLTSFDSSKWDFTNIAKMEALFQLCPLESIDNISTWKTPNLTNMRAMFCKCINLKKVPDMVKWDTKNVKDMSSLFNGCISIEKIPKFPSWNTANVEDMSYMFSRCIKLKEINDLQKFNTVNVKSMCSIFNRCENLIKLPDIAKWNLINVTDISNTFKSCCKLTKFPDIHKWNLSKVKDISGVFCGCSSSKILPNIGKWNTSSVEFMSELFKGCNTLTEIPDISKWNTSKVTDMSGMFWDCHSIIKLPNLSNWNTSNLSNMSYMLAGCSNLTDVSTIKNWDTSKVVDKNDIYRGCTNLKI